MEILFQDIQRRFTRLFLNANSGENGLWNKIGISEWCEFNEPNAVIKFL